MINNIFLSVLLVATGLLVYHADKNRWWHWAQLGLFLIGFWVFPWLGYLVLATTSALWQFLYQKERHLAPYYLSLFAGVAALVTLFSPALATPILLTTIIASHHLEVFARLNRLSRAVLLGTDIILVALFLVSDNLGKILTSLVTFGVLALVSALITYLFQETDMVYARSVDQIMANYVHEVNSLYAQIRGWRHDYHNHLQTLNAQLKVQHTDEALNYLRELDVSLGEVDQIVKSGNTTIDAVVNSKLAIAERAKIPTNVKVFVGSTPLAHEIELVVILGNILGNAIEANLEIADPDKRVLRIYVAIMQQQLYITVTNARSDAQIILPEFASTKNDKRGLGIRRINALVAKFNGIINRQYEDGFFVTEVLLPLVSLTEEGK